MTEFVDVQGGQIAYDVTGQGPLVVLSHGIGDRRQAYRFLAPKLAAAGYRVANADVRGHGDSSMGWASISRTDADANVPVAMARYLAARIASRLTVNRGEGHLIVPKHWTEILATLLSVP